MELRLSCTGPSICILKSFFLIICQFGETEPERKIQDFVSIDIGYPAGTRRNNNVIMTSKRRRFDVIMTSLLRHVPTGLVYNVC